MLARLPIALAALVSITASSAAQGRYAHRGLEQGYVTAESRFGHGSVSGAVRASRNGNEVRLPGGTWIPCGRSCSETLRVESVDFWENRGAGPSGRIDNECGLLGCLSVGRRF
jgi:hypothetical protein